MNPTDPTPRGSSPPAPNEGERDVRRSKATSGHEPHEEAWPRDPPGQTPASVDPGDVPKTAELEAKVAELADTVTTAVEQIGTLGNDVEGVRQLTVDVRSHGAVTRDLITGLSRQVAGLVDVIDTLRGDVIAGQQLLHDEIVVAVARHDNLANLVGRLDVRTNGRGDGLGPGVFGRLGIEPAPGGAVRRPPQATFRDRIVNAALQQLADDLGGQILAVVGGDVRGRLTDDAGVQLAQLVVELDDEVLEGAQP